MDPKLVLNLEKKIDSIKQRREHLLGRVKNLTDQRELEDVLRLNAILSVKQHACRQRVNRQRFERRDFSGLESVNINPINVRS